MFNKLKIFFASIVSKIETISIYKTLFVFFAAVTLRNIIEPLSTGYGYKLTLFIHYTSFYVALIFALALANKFILKISHEASIKFFSIGSCSILLAPLIDLLFYGGGKMEYLYPKNWQDVISWFLTFFGPMTEHGVTIGIRIEIIVILFLIGSLAFIKTNSLFKTIFSLIISYTIIFTAGIMPYISLGIYFNIKNIATQTMSITYIFLLIFLAELNLYFYWTAKKAFIAFWQNIRLTRILHFAGMFVFGFTLAATYIPGFTCQYLAVAVAVTTIFISCFICLLVNDITDRREDLLNSPQRPLIEGTLTIQNYYQLIILFSLILIFFCLGFNFFYSILFPLLFIATYTLYSCPPFRFKRIPFFSKFLIGLNSLLMILYGYVFARGNFDFFPESLFWYFLIFFPLAINFIDLKDAAGDKATNLKTLPVLLGLKRARHLTGFFVVLCYILTIPVLDIDMLFWPILFIGAGFSYYFLAVTKTYNERYFFIVYLLTVGGVILNVIIL